MPDEPLDPETEERVRRLLAEARHTEPMPADVADRLDRVLAGLADEPATVGRVVRLADRRRRAATLLVAAAAVVVAGVGIGGIVHQQGGGGSPSADSAAGGAEEAPRAASRRDVRQPSDHAVQGYSASDAPTAALPIRPQHFSDDVLRARKQTALASSMDAIEMDGRTNNVFGVVPLGRCREPGWGTGRFVAVRYGSSPGYLVFRTPAGDTQVADLFLCGVADAVRSITLPRP